MGKVNKYRELKEKSHAARLRGYQKEVITAIDSTIKDIGKQISLLQSKQALSPDKYIEALKRNKVLQKQLKITQEKLYSNLNEIVSSQIENEFIQANKMGDYMVSYYTDSYVTTKLNTEALQAFVSRKIKGITLSERLWNVSKSVNTIVEEHLATGITQGKSTVRIVKDLINSIDNPSSLLKTPREAGQYKDVKKALTRIVRSETNSAYRNADIQRIQKMDFVLGYRVSLSLSHPAYDICDALAGDYPKAFFFGGWHPNCFCILTTILQSKEDFKSKKTPNYVKRVPVQSERMVKTFGNSKLKGAPWIVDNYTKSLNLKQSVGKRRTKIKPYKIDPKI